MAHVSLNRAMDRVSLVFDCDDDEEATEIYSMLASQILDGKSINIVLEPVKELDS